MASSWPSTSTPSACCDERTSLVIRFRKSKKNSRTGQSPVYRFRGSEYLPAVRSHPGLATKELMAEFGWAGTDAKHPVKSLPPFFSVMSFTMSRVGPGARSRGPAGDVMALSRAVHPPCDEIGPAPVRAGARARRQTVKVRTSLLEPRRRHCEVNGLWCHNPILFRRK